jgi:hypothetical protein
LLGITQRAACGFALGALLTFWLRVVFTDMVFGWQSSAGWPMERWHAVAQAIAAPWTWLFPGACPTVEQVRASHFTYVGGVETIDETASLAWWPFLAGCLLVWGAGVRTVFILLIGWRQRAALHAPQFQHSDGNALARALTGPLFASGEGSYHPGVTEAAANTAPHAPGRHWLVLVSEPEQAASVPRVLEAALRGAAGSQYPVAIDDPPANAGTLAAVRESGDPVAVLVRAARDPILAIKKTLGAVVEAARGRECVVLLAGDPDRLPLWRKFAAAHRLDMEMISVP